MRKWIAILVTLLTSISITGISFIDDLMITRVVAGLVSAAFLIVGVLYKIGVIDGKRKGQDAFKGVFIILLIFAFVIYLEIRKFQEWAFSWPLAVKIIVPSALGFLLTVMIALMIYDRIKNSDKYEE